VTVPLRLSTSLLKRSDIKSPPCPVALTETEQNRVSRVRRKSQSEPSPVATAFSFRLKKKKNTLQSCITPLLSALSCSSPELPVCPTQHTRNFHTCPEPECVSTHNTNVLLADGIRKFPDKFCCRASAPCSCSFCFFFSSFLSLTLRSLAFPMPPAWRMDSSRLARPVEGFTTSFGAPCTAAAGRGRAGVSAPAPGPAKSPSNGLLRYPSARGPGNHGEPTKDTG